MLLNLKLKNNLETISEINITNQKVKIHMILVKDHKVQTKDKY